MNTFKPAWNPRVLLAEDDSGMRAVIRYNLEEDGFSVTEVTRGDDAIELLTPVSSEEPPFDLVITDLKMPGADGMDVLRAAHACHASLQVVLVTAFGSVDHAIEAMSQGAADYITKPFQRAEFKTRISAVMERLILKRENRALRERVESQVGPSLVAESPRMQEVIRIVDRVASSDATVLLTGESGTGKELLARRLHTRSEHRSGPFVPVNCAALPRDLLESELFGHERGAFTGAERTHRGKFERAHQGTLFLDEIGELHPDLQSKILRVLEEGILDRVGASQRISIEVRIVAASNRDLPAEVAAGRFRADLYHRLSVIPIHLPPLRERPEDIRVLVGHLLQELGLGGRVAIAPSLLDELRHRPWPGNVRELKNTIERMALLRRSDVLDLADLALPGDVVQPMGEPRPDAAQPRSGSLLEGRLQPGQLELPDEPFRLLDLEREIILKALEKHKGNRSATARYLGIPRHVLLYRLEKYQGGSVE